ncbi:MAG TPA: DUF4369 domain-containing protein, partial [Pedobacter sp.]
MNPLTNKNLKALGMLFICSLSLNSIAQVKKNFVINGSLNNMAAMPAKIYLNYDNVSGKKPDSAVVKDGKYILKGTVDISVLATVALLKGDVKQGKDELGIMLDQGVLAVNSDQSLSNSTVTGTGAAANDEYHKITAFAFNESAAIKKIMESDAYKTDETVKKSVQDRSRNLLGNALMNVIGYIRKNPESPVSPYFTYTMLASGFVTPEMMDTLNRALPASARTTSVGKGIDEVFQKRKKAALEAAAVRKAADDKIPLGSKA